MEFDKKKITIGLFSVLVLGSVATYAAFNSNEPEPQVTTQSSQGKSVIQKAKGNKSNDSLEKSKKGKKKSGSLGSVAGNDNSFPSIIDSAQNGSKKTIDRSPINQTMAAIDKQAKVTNPKVNQPTVLNYKVPTKATDTQDTTKKGDTGNKSDNKGQVQGPEVPIIVEPSNPEPPTNPVNPTPSVSYSALVAILQQASQLTRNNYTPNSLASLDSVTQEGYKMISAQTASQQQVNLQVQRIQQALNNLREKADKSVMNDKITTADSLDLAEFTPETVTVLTEALESAKKVQNDDNATQADVDQENISLQTAIDQLVKRADKTNLSEQIQKAENINREIYLPESLTALDTALESAKTVNNDPNASQTTVDQTKSKLEQAIADLQEKEEPEKTLVLIRQLIAECESLVETNYTPQSYQVLSTELAAAKTFVTQANVTVAEATAQLTALENAKDQLVKRADTTKLQSAITEAQALSEDDYTPTSWGALQTALSGADSLKNNANATQAEVNQKESEIKTAISALVKK